MKRCPARSSTGLSAFERAGADFGAGHIGENGDGPLVAAGGGAQESDGGGVFGVRAVREVEPGHVHAGAHQAVDHDARAAGRAQGADDLGAAGRAAVGGYLAAANS